MKLIAYLDLFFTRIMSIRLYIWKTTW